MLPSNKLPVALWLEADRMRGLSITEQNLTNQKDAVKEEKRLRMQTSPMFRRLSTSGLSFLPELEQLSFTHRVFRGSPTATVKTFKILQDL